MMSSVTDDAPTAAPAPTPVRLSMYWPTRSDYDDARAAYVVATSHGHPAASFAAWVADVVRTHTDLTPEQRAAVAIAAPAPPRSARGSAAGLSRTVVLDPADADLPDLIAAASCADRAQGRAAGPSQFVAEAIRVAVAAARHDVGGVLPPAPARLPNRRL